MKSTNRDVGRIGEEAAEKYLSNKGYVIVEKNYASKFGEIDLICQDKDKLVFVEVKTKRGVDFGTPEEMFTSGKKRKVKRMATIYLSGREVACRIDMVAVELDSQCQVLNIRHYENAG